jgi:CHAT domain-containing protein
VIASLWNVDDASTCALMTKFYERWKAGAAPATALREAQLFIAAQPKWRHPYYWAAWQLWGLPD